MSRPRLWNDYDPNVSLPLFGYILLVVVFTTMVGAMFFHLHRRGFFRTPFLDRLRPMDLALLAIATHQLSWMIGRDRVLAPLRAFFAFHESSGGVGELNDVPRGSGVLHAIGDLITCPYCLGPWVAAVLFFAFVKWPRPTRMATVVLTLVATSNVLHQGYTLLKHASS